jgi:hypothetical protein
MDGNHENAADTYGVALAALMTYSPPIRIGSSVMMGFLSHLRTLIHNNMGQISYLDCDDRNAIVHFDEALRLSKLTSPFRIGDAGKLEIATFASNLARTYWMIGNVYNDSCASTLLGGPSFAIVMPPTRAPRCRVCSPQHWSLALPT